VEPRNLTFVQILLRGIIVFLVTLAAVRIEHNRSLSRKTPFGRRPACDSCRSTFSRHSTHDLDEDMSLSVHIDDLSMIRIARVERSGEIGFIKK
jgi:uncharacterized membrane protein YcaP (DUF421 family)